MVSRIDPGRTRGVSRLAPPHVCGLHRAQLGAEELGSTFDTVATTAVGTVNEVQLSQESSTVAPSLLLREITERPEP